MGKQLRFGIAEWYGRDFVALSPAERRGLANISPRRCPFISTTNRPVDCSKPGGVCSIRLYQKDESGAVAVADSGTVRVTCPIRFEQGKTIYQWIAETILSDPSAVPIGQVTFLERVPLIGSDGTVAVDPSDAKEGVGRIDNVLIVPNSKPLRWCPVEIQAVYFSGDKMELDFASIRTMTGAGLPFPAGKRRPDYRSSGPKRLMPQLQIKVPTLRRWGKKMAVVVDEDFFKAMGRIATIPDLSNCDVAWFVVGFDETARGLKLVRRAVHFATLEESVQGLIAGKPVSQPVFENRILAKLSGLSSDPSQVPTDE